MEYPDSLWVRILYLFEVGVDILSAPTLIFWSGSYHGIHHFLCVNWSESIDLEQPPPIKFSFWELDRSHRSWWVAGCHFDNLPLPNQVFRMTAWFKPERLAPQSKKYVEVVRIKLIRTKIWKEVPAMPDPNTIELPKRRAAIEPTTIRHHALCQVQGAGDHQHRGP